METLRLDPRREKDLIDIDDPRVEKLRTEIAEPSLVNPRTDIDDPRIAKLRVEKPPLPARTLE